MCKSCKYIFEVLGVRYGEYGDIKKVVSEIKYEGFYWGRYANIPLNYCPDCGKKLTEYKEEEIYEEIDREI